MVPRNFWSRLAGTFGIKYYWQTNGEGAAVVNAVSAIDSCLREEEGPSKCVKVERPLQD